MYKLKGFFISLNILLRKFIKLFLYNAVQLMLNIRNVLHLP